MLKSYKIKNRVEVGVDEAGYGSFYGRVYAAAVVWPQDFEHPLIKDSKKLSPKQRDEAFEIVKKHAITYGISYCEAEEIDRINIRRADIKAMHKAIDQCNVLPEVIMVDGVAFETYWDKTGEPVSHELIVNGDGTYACIAAASILAKVSRDRWIDEVVQKQPELDWVYGLSKNKGYGSEEHRNAIKLYGLSDGHRKVGYGSKFEE